jgi:hypothetical protein
VVSKVSNDVTSEQGVPLVCVNVMVATISMREPEVVALEKGRLTETISLLATVKLVLLPMAAPVAPVKATVPVQDAAVPLDDALAVFKRLTCAVSVLPKPTGPKLDVWVKVLDPDCASAETAVPTSRTTGIKTNLRNDMGDLLEDFDW